MVRVGVIGLVHNVESGRYVRIEHPLFRAGQVAAVVRMKVLGISDDSFQVAEPDVRISDQMQRRGEGRGGVGRPTLVSPSNSILTSLTTSSLRDAALGRNKSWLRGSGGAYHIAFLLQSKHSCNRTADGRFILA
jgi:hypothetical protein